MKSRSFLVTVFALALAVEATVLTAAYFGADDVECESVGPIPLYCTFTSEQISSDVTIRKMVNRSKTCYVNGEKVNCSEDFIKTNQGYYEDEFND